MSLPIVYLLAFFALLSPVFAIPLSLSWVTKGLFGRDSGFGGGYGCQTTEKYNVTGEYGIQLPPQLVAGAMCNATYSGCTIGNTQGYAVTVTTTLGADLSLGHIFGLGLHADISISTTNAEAITTSVQCPPGYTCGIEAIATVYNVTGWKETSCNTSGGWDCTCNNRYEYYEVHFPVLVPNSQKNAQAQVEYSICLVSGSVNSYRKPDAIPFCPGYPAPLSNDTNFATGHSS